MAVYPKGLPLDFFVKKEKSVGHIKFLKDIFDDKLNHQIFTIIKDKHLNDVAKYERIR